MTAQNAITDLCRTDIDYMNQYRDFENDQVRYSYVEGAKFLSQLHESGQHYIPIVDSAIYVPNPENASDAYPIFNRGNASDAFMLNPDGSLYIGEVWPGMLNAPRNLGHSATFVVEHPRTLSFKVKVQGD